MRFVRRVDGLTYEFVRRDDPGFGALPPDGLWASAKGDKGYAYDLRSDGEAR